MVRRPLTAPSTSQKKKDLAKARSFFFVTTFALLAGASLGKVPVDFSHKLPSRSWSTDLAIQDLCERHLFSIQVIGSLVVLLHLGAVDINTCEQALRVRVGQDFRIQLPVSVSRCFTANRTSGRACVNANFEFAGKQLLRTFVIHHQHQQVGGLTADLCAPASAAKEHRRRSAPSVTVAGGTAGSEATAITAAESQGSLLFARDSNNAFRVFQQIRRYALIRRRENFLQYGCRGVQTLGNRRVVVAKRRRCSWFGLTNGDAAEGAQEQDSAQTLRR